jgi:glycosyltransferase involved in cell wall biosynthesis
MAARSASPPQQALEAAMLDRVAPRALVAQSRPAGTVTVVILTFNEEVHIRRAIESVREIAEEILVVDSFSTDRTVAIAKAAGARVVEHRFVNQSQQFNWALDSLAIDADWILRLDADEVLEADLRDNIRAFLQDAPADVAALNFKRKHVFMGRWIRHGGRYPLIVLRMWRRGKARVEDRWMDEHVVAWGGRTITLDGGLADISLHDLSRFTEKHNKYATREAIQIVCQKWKIPICDTAGRLDGQPKRKRLVKELVFNRMPFHASAMLYFLFRYFVQLGFLDGRPGLIYHLLQAFWYRLLIGAKVVELETQISGCTSSAERLAAIRRLTGLKVEEKFDPELLLHSPGRGAETT